MLDRRVDESRARVARQRAKVLVHRNDPPGGRRQHDAVRESVDQLLERRRFGSPALLKHYRDVRALSPRGAAGYS
jgi:hypothetical protein